jgi:hypothetical protein
MEELYSEIKDRDEEHSRASLDAIPPEYHNAVGQLMEASFRAGKDAGRRSMWPVGLR